MRLFPGSWRRVACRELLNKDQMGRLITGQESTRPGEDNNSPAAQDSKREAGQRLGSRSGHCVANGIMASGLLA